MLAISNVSKSFDGNAALTDVSAEARKGRVLAICGENGAGKSTLMKILAGAVRPDRGEIRLDGEGVRLGDPRTAIELGIRTVHQDLSLLPHLSVAENMLLGHMPHRGRGFVVDWKAANAHAAAVIAEFGFPDIDVNALVSELPISVLQIVEIAKALVVRPRVLILDEPSAVLSAHETQLLFRRIRELTAAGTTVLYISHRLDEIFDISDDVLVLKDGRAVLHARTAEVSRGQLVNAMIGRSLDAIYPDRDHEPGEVVLEARDLGRGSAYRDIAFTVRAGEIVGMFGLVGSGRTEIARAICGAQPAQTGRILIGGKEAALASPADAIASGIAFITEDRMRDGLALDCPVLDNAGLASMDRFAAGGILHRARQKDAVTRKLDELNVRPRGSNRPVRQLSGGNQQKVVLAKWMLIENLRIFVFDEPTRGVDIATKVEIYRMLVALAAAGKAILLISSELPEIVGLSDRVIVLREGRITAELTGPDLSMETIFAHAAGPERLGAA